MLTSFALSVPEGVCWDCQVGGGARTPGDVVDVLPCIAHTREVAQRLKRTRYCSAWRQQPWLGWEHGNGRCEGDPEKLTLSGVQQRSPAPWVWNKPKHLLALWQAPAADTACRMNYCWWKDCLKSQICREGCVRWLTALKPGAVLWHSAFPQPVRVSHKTLKCSAVRSAQCNSSTPVSPASFSPSIHPRDAGAGPGAPGAALGWSPLPPGGRCPPLRHAGGLGVPGVSGCPWLLGITGKQPGDASLGLQVPDK